MSRTARVKENASPGGRAVRSDRSGETGTEMMNHSRCEFLKPSFAVLAFLSFCAMEACSSGVGDAGFRQESGLSRRPVAFKVVQWNIGHFAHGRAKRTAVTAKESAGKSAEYRAMIEKLKPDFLGVSEFDPVFDKAGRLSTNELFASFPTRILGPKVHYQCNALFTHFPCVRHEIVNFAERRQKTYFIDAVFLFGTNEVHFVQTHLDWARLPDQNKRHPTDRRYAQRQIKQLVRHFKDVPYVIVSADFNVSRRWHFKEFDKAGYTVANTGRYKLLDNVVVKGFDVKDLFSADDQLRLSDHRIVGCVLEMRE